MSVLNHKISSFVRSIRRTAPTLFLFYVSLSMAQMSGGLPPLTTNNAGSGSLTQSTPTPTTSAARRAPQQYTLQVLGQQLLFTNPVGYCSPGQSKREKDLVEGAKQFLDSSVRLIHIAARCEELEAYREGRRDSLDHWMQIQMIGPKGDFKRIEMSREAFLNGISKSSPRIEFNEIMRKSQSMYQQFDVDLSNTNMTPIGRDGNAFYVSIQMTLGQDNVKTRVTGLGAMTLVNAVPLNILFYEATGTTKSRDQLAGSLRGSLTSLFTEN
jgi:hypothetical protein